MIAMMIGDCAPEPPLRQFPSAPACPIFDFRFFLVANFVNFGGEFLVAAFRFCFKAFPLPSPIAGEDFRSAAL
jgi:hypothetical protein